MRLSPLSAAISRLSLCLIALLATAASAQNTIHVPADQPTIQAGINAANNGDTVLVAPGTYTGDISFAGKAITLKSAAGPSTTILDGGALPGAVVSLLGPGNNINPTLSGFTIQNGGAAATGLQGAVVISNNFAVIENNIITKAFCAGITSSAAGPVITGNQINRTVTTGCTPSEGLGSAIRVTGSRNPEGAFISNNLIELNTASAADASDFGGGAAINITNATFPLIYNNTLRNNATAGYGGALYLANTFQVYFINNLVYGNTGITGGLDLVIPGSSVGNLAGILGNNTIVANTGLSTGAHVASDVYIGGNLAQYAIANNVIGGYVDGQPAFNCAVAYSSQTITPLVFDHNDIYSLNGNATVPVAGACTSPSGTTGNISMSPQFVSAAPASIAAGTADFHLTAGSPAIDSGNNSAVDVGIVGRYDVSGQPRVQDATGKTYGTVDMGAYEFAGTQDSYLVDLLVTPTSYTPAPNASFTLIADVQGTSVALSGSVTFYVDNLAIGTISSAAGNRYELNLINGLNVGLHNIYATYSAPIPYASTGSLLQYILVTAANATSTTLSCTPNPIAINATTLCTIHVTSSNGTPTGSVTLTDGNTTLATLPLTAGSATYTYIGTSAGIHNLTASYSVTGTFNASSASFSLTVNGLPTTTTATVSPNPSIYGQPTIFTVHVAPVSPTASVPSGTVVITFCRGATITLALDATGSASVTTPLANGIPEPAGSCPFTATYQGDTTFNSSTSASVSYVVNPAPSTTTIVASPIPAYALTPVTITVTVAANPSPTLSSTGQIIPPAAIIATGTVSLLDGSTFLAKATLVNGQAVFTVTTLAVGQHTLTANFFPDFNLNASSATTGETILANTTATTLTASPNPGVQSQQITLIASAVDTTSSVVPLGSMQFFNGTTLLGTVQLSATGTATLTTSFSAGQQSITAVYIPSSTAFLPSTSSPITLIIASQDFTFTTTTPSITIQTQHHSSLQLTLTSNGGFTGPVALGCGAPLPIYLTCELPPKPIILAANAKIPITLTLDTDEVLNFLAVTRPRTRTNTANRIAFALLLPFAALPFAVRRRKLRHLLSLLCLAVLCSAVTACTGYYPPSTPPGTYTIPLTATGTSSAFSTTPITHTLNITLTVTP